MLSPRIRLRRIQGFGAILAAWIVTMIKAYGDTEWEIPFLGALARKQLDSRTPRPL